MKKITLALLFCMAMPLCMVGQGYTISIPPSAKYVSQTDTQYIFCVGSYLTMPLEMQKITAPNWYYTLSTTTSSSSSYETFNNRIMNSSDDGKWIRITVIEADSSVHYSNALQIHAKSPSVVTETQEACDRYLWHGVTYTESTMVPVFLTQNIYGCDSTVTLHLTIKHSSKNITNVETCDSYTWLGTSFTASVDTLRVGTNAANCPDSNILHLVIHHSDLGGSESANVCDSYTWHGISYNVSGSYTYNTQTTHGCDSMCTLVLTVRNSTASTESHTACDSFTWRDGNTYTSSIITPTVTLTNATGCDSIIRLVLTVNYSNTGDTNAVVCDHFTWWNTNYINSTNATHTFANGNIKGCDSTVTLHLTVKQSTNSVDIIQACDSLTWIDGNKYSTSTITPTFTLKNVEGCDSIVTLNLTVFPSTHFNEIYQACNSYVWPRNNHFYSASNSSDWVWGGSDLHHCDSIIHLQLTVTYSNLSDTVATVCDMLNWHGVNRTTTGSYIYTYLGSGVCIDSVVLHLTVNYSNTGDTTAVTCDAFNWWNTNYTNSTDAATHTFANGNTKGCDSTVTLHLTVKQSTSSVDLRQACDSLTWIDGITYTSSNNSSQFTIPNSQNCDSTITLNLTIHQTIHHNENHNACNNFLWLRNGRYYTFSNNSDWVLGGKDNHQCDSIIHLNLTINNSNRTDTFDTVCDGMNWYGQQHNSSGEYIHTQEGAGLCTDSIVLHLTVNPSTSGIEWVTACDSTEWHGMKYYASTNTPQYSMADGNSKGCDSTVTLHLTLHRGEHQTFNAVVCDSYQWERTGLTYTNSDTYTHQYTSQDGCQSVDTLHLTVKYSTNGVDVREVCDSMTWIDGNIYTSTQNATFVILNSVGCDSTITLDLTVHYSNHNSQSEDVCDGYTWAANGNHYTRSGRYVYNTTDSYGCEVSNVLDLNIRHSSHETIHEAVCESYEWVRGNNRRTFTSSTETAINYVNDENCPSVDSLYLIVYGFPIPEVRQLVEKRHKGSANPWMLIYPRNSGEDEYYYQWYRNGIPLNGANKQYYQLPYENAGDNVIYSVWVAAANFSVCASQSYDTIQFQQNKSLNVITFPNPAVDHFDVSVESDDFEAVWLDIYSEMGSLVYSTPMQGNSISVTEKLSSGIYILKVSSKDGNSVTRKVIIDN